MAARKSAKSTATPSVRKRPAHELATLPPRLMLDSSVVIMALEYDNKTRKADARLRDCRELWERALGECTILLPPFVVLEVLLGSESLPLPPVKNLLHVAFTYEVAEGMSAWAGPSATKRIAKEHATPRHHVSYDALIVGAAKFYGADVLVTLDPAVVALGALANVRTAAPSDMLRWTQRGLPGI